jgi:N-glycosylase/DNA lyase
MKLVEIPAPDFDLAITLASGQVFHWQKMGDGFVGTIGDLLVYVEQRGELLRAKVASASSRYPGNNAQDAQATIAHYFALDHPLAEICASFPDDPMMNAARKFCRGLRIIRQPKWECLATFICSSMKQVTHIRQISRALRERFGKPCNIDSPNYGFARPFLRRGRRSYRGSGALAAVANNSTVYTFPPAQRLAESSESELRKCALGYRAKNLRGTAELVDSPECNLEAWAALPDAELRKRLCALPGVGAKVANCVMLFAYQRLRAFPIDVWIERVLRTRYFPRRKKITAQQLREFSETYFGEHGGYAQQYLFHHARVTMRKSGVSRDSSTPLRSARNDKRKGAQRRKAQI